MSASAHPPNKLSYLAKRSLTTHHNPAQERGGHLAPAIQFLCFRTQMKFDGYIGGESFHRAEFSNTRMSRIKATVRMANVIFTQL